jgi:hypothetical protein
LGGEEKVEVKAKTKAKAGVTQSRRALIKAEVTLALAGGCLVVQSFF